MIESLQKQITFDSTGQRYKDEKQLGAPKDEVTSMAGVYPSMFPGMISVNLLSSES